MWYYSKCLCRGPSRPLIVHCVDSGGMRVKGWAKLLCTDIMRQCKRCGQSPRASERRKVSFHMCRKEWGIKCRRKAFLLGKDFWKLSGNRIGGQICLGCGWYMAPYGPMSSVPVLCLYHINGACLCTFLPSNGHSRL